MGTKRLRIMAGRSMEERIIATAQLGIKFIEAWLNPMI
jgi:hypothetical protein